MAMCSTLAEVVCCFLELNGTCYKFNGPNDILGLLIQSLCGILAG